MSVFFRRIDAAPLEEESFGFEFSSWVSIFIDTMNETLRQIEDEIVSRETIDGTSIVATVNSSYIVNNAGLTSITLPDATVAGSEIRIVGKGAGGWMLLPGVGQTIKVSASSASTSIASTDQYDCITIVCVTDNTTWVTTSSQTSGFTII